MDYIVYLLKNTNTNHTYVGITNNPERRIRMHNGEIKGGARYTRMNKGNGNWVYYGCIIGLDKHTALSIEKKIHNQRGRGKGKSTLEKRMSTIHTILQVPLYENIEFIFF
jgi:predicted GIY-YIG superfamily endonuclease